MRKRLFATIGYADTKSTGPRTCPDCETESQQFRIQLRKTGFLNPNENDRCFESLGGHNKLSEEMKSFSKIAQDRRINYIKEKFNSTKPSFTRPIPITINDVRMQSAESSMKKEELVLVIESLIGSLNETN